MFGFIDAQHEEGSAPLAFKDLEESRKKALEQSGGQPTAISAAMVDKEEEEDISEYQFSKFAATYFQGDHSTTFEKKALMSPLLALKNEGDQMVISSCPALRVRFRHLPHPSFP